MNMNGMNLNGMGGMGMNMNGMNMGNMNPNMSHHPGMGNMMPSNQSNMPGQHPQHTMSNMNSMNSMMGMGMNMNPSNNGNPNSMNMGMGHTSMGHMPHNSSHTGHPHHPMMNMNSMHGMNHQMSGMGNMGMNNNNGMNPMNSMHGIQSMSNQSTTNSGYPSSYSTNSNGNQSIAQMEWRAQFTREHRANLIAKMYNEMVRVSTEPPGIALWINVAWFELKLYKECQTQEDYINKILKRLQHLKTQGGEMPTQNHTMNNNNMMGNQTNQQHSNNNYYTTSTIPSGNLSINTNNNNSTGFTSSSQPGSLNSTPKPQQKPKPNQIKQSNGINRHQMNTIPGNNDQIVNPMANNNPTEYWRQHGLLKAKYLNDVSTVHSAFKKYVDHMKDQNESEQKQKLTYLLGYVELCAKVLEEDSSTSQARPLEELDKVNKYVIRIVHPYLKKLKAEKDRRTSSGNNTPQGNNFLQSNNHFQNMMETPIQKSNILINEYSMNNNSNQYQQFNNQNNYIGNNNYDLLNLQNNEIHFLDMENNNTFQMENNNNNNNSNEDTDGGDLMNMVEAL